MSSDSRKDRRRYRHTRIRKKVSGTGERPRLCVMISNRRIYAQLIDDDGGVTLAGGSTSGEPGTCTVEGARNLGKAIGKDAVDKGIGSAVMDRGGYRFHGRVKALAEGAAESGLRTGATAADASAKRKKDDKEDK